MRQYRRDERVARNRRSRARPRAAALLHGRDGSITGLKIETSGDPGYDADAIKAIVESATPLPPLSDNFNERLTARASWIPICRAQAVTRRWEFTRELLRQPYHRSPHRRHNSRLPRR